MRLNKLPDTFVKHKVTVPLGDRSYEIMIGPGVLSEVHIPLNALFTNNAFYVICDSNCHDLLGLDLETMLRGHGLQVECISFQEGEQSKNLSTVETICRELVKKGADRTSVILALGGGVTGDIAGFVASIYMRGIPFVQIPTTLLAQVDSSVGGKTGVDLPEGKNLVGTFYQPRLVLADIATLATLPNHELKNGLAEVVKYGAIWDSEFFCFLEDHAQACLELEPDVIAQVVRRSCEIKAEVVSRDEREGGLRRILNFGHTIGHAIEAASNFTVSHGQAVSIGMVAAARLSCQKGYLSAHEVSRLKHLLETLELPTELPQGISHRALLSLIKHDKKAQKGRVHFVLLKGIGETIITPEISDQEILNAMEGGKAGLIE